MPRCQAIVGTKTRCQIDLRQQCQQSAAHWVDGGVGLCGTHFNAGFRKELEVVRPLRVLHDGDM